MAIKIKEIGVESFLDYAEIPISFTVESILQVEAIDRGLGGFSLVEKEVTSYLKDYDRQGENGDRPTVWAKKFDVSKWGFFLATDGSITLGGATVAVDTPSMIMLEKRKDLAVLWDIRVRPDLRRGGIGTKLFRHTVDWAKRRGYKQLKVETQNVNVPACRFYAKQGCELGAIHQYAYASSPDVAHETMLLWYLKL
ncbi:MAG: GNAT family N-acetyltransferase [Candidatus Hodarchaeota archaeon]